jgi:hypothetical protein
MKRILFLLAMILIGVNVSFASNKKEKKAENMALYEQAVKAVQEKKFVVKFHTYDGPKRRIKVNNLTNFLMVDGNSTLRQYDDGRRFWGYANGGFPNYESPKMKEGYVSDVLVDIDKNGKVVCTLLYRTEGKPDSFTEIVFKKGSNKCTMIRHSRGLKSYSWGTIHPIGETEIRKAI